MEKMTPPGTPAALILAGGRGERLGGVVKSELRVGGVRLLDRVAAGLADVVPVLVAHGRIDPALLGLAAGMIPVPDLEGDYAGPLAGFAGAMAYLNTQVAPPELLICVAVDTPFLPTGYVARLIEALGDGDAAIACYGGQPYPTNSIWRTARFRDLPERVVKGIAPRSLKALAAEVGGGMIEWPFTAAGDPFANVNTPDDLSEMERRAAIAAVSQA